jgi:hypothetical protein
MSDSSLDLSAQEEGATGLVGLFNRLAGAIIALFVKADPFLTPAPSTNQPVALPFETE